MCIKQVSSVAFVLLLSACATERAVPSTNVSAPAPASNIASVSMGNSQQSVDVSALDQLWKSRASTAADFPIGVGDLIEISFPGETLETQSSSPTPGDHFVDESLSASTVRVDAQGKVVLPLLGSIHVAGLTEEELRRKLVQLLDRYMYDPEVKVFVKSYRSREVAVSGEVHAPGIYTIIRPADTVRDLISRAGGMTADAAQKIVFAPGKAGAGTPSTSSAELDNSETPVPNEEASPEADATLLAATQYVLDLSSINSAEHYLALPVRPGDMIYVPKAGTVTVTGWVYSPRSINISQGLTVLGAVSQAGGTLFAADASRVKVLRQEKGQKTQTIVVNLKHVKAARVPDMLVQANDVIDVPYSAARIPGYALYYTAQGLVSFAPSALIVNGVP